MFSNNLGVRCKFASKCPVYRGNNNNIKIPHFLYKNIYCNRGIKGWSYCYTYNDFINNKHISVQNNCYRCLFSWPLEKTTT